MKVFEVNHNVLSSKFLVRVLYLTYYMANGCLQPYLSLYYASMGYGGQIIGLIGSIAPFTTFLVGPMWGILSDASGKPFAILYLTIAVTLIGQLLVGMVNNTFHVMALVTIKAIFHAPVRSLIDTLVLQQLPDRSEYGKVKLWSILGTGIGTSCAGFFIRQEADVPIEWTKNASFYNVVFDLYRSMTGYRLLFVVHALLHIPVFITLRKFQKQHARMDDADHHHQNNEVETPNSPNGSSKDKSMSFKEVLALMTSDLDAFLLFAVVYGMGIAGGIADNFTYVRFQEVGATGANMGFSRLLASLGGALMFWYSGALIKALGSKTVVEICLVSVTIRCGLYVIMDHPIYGYAAETIRGLTFGSFWSTATVYANDIAPPAARATMLQILNGLYNGIGRSTGSVVGGHLQATVGTANTFLYGAVFYAVLAVLYASMSRMTPTYIKMKMHEK